MTEDPDERPYRFGEALGVVLTGVIVQAGKLPWRDVVRLLLVVGGTFGATEITRAPDRIRLEQGVVADKVLMGTQFAAQDEIAELQRQVDRLAAVVDSLTQE